MYCEMLGHDVGFAYIPVLQMASDPNLLNKKVRRQGSSRSSDRFGCGSACSVPFVCWHTLRAGIGFAPDSMGSACCLLWPAVVLPPAGSLAFDGFQPCPAGARTQLLPRSSGPDSRRLSSHPECCVVPALYMMLVLLPPVIQAAYLCLTQLLDYKHELVLLLVNTLLSDLKNDNFVVIATALVVTSKLIGADLINAGEGHTRARARVAG